MNRELVAWPSIELLSRETGLSDRTVGTHLQTLEDQGWIARSRRSREGKGWRNYQYRLTRPAAPTTRAERASGACRAHAGELASAALGGQPRASVVAAEDLPVDAERGCTVVPKDVPANSEMIIGSNTTCNSSTAKVTDNPAGQQPRGVHPNPGDADDNCQGDGRLRKEPTSVPEWADFLGLKRHPGEHYGQFQLRVTSAYERWKLTRSKPESTG
jgi:DNA-binding transcriptional ArsR family regulator